MRPSAILMLLLTMLWSQMLQAECHIRVAWEPWAPLLFEKNGVATGLDNDLTRTIVENAGCEVSFHQRPWARSLREIANGNIDATAAASLTSERQEYAHYSISYRNETMILLTTKGLSAKYPLTSLNDITKSDFKLGVTLGVYYGEEYESVKSIPAVNQHFYRSTGYYKNFEKLLSGHIDGMLGDKISLMHMAKEKGVLDKVEIHPLPINSDKVYFIFSKKSVSESVVEKINKSILEIQANGQYNKLFNQYMK